MSATQQDPARRITTKFINLRKFIKLWRSNLYTLNQVIQKVKSVIYLLETLGLLRDLSLPEWNFGKTLCGKLCLLKMQKRYWKQREKITWIKEGDAGTKIFHAHATMRHIRNTISFLCNDQGMALQDMDKKHI